MPTDTHLAIGPRVSLTEASILDAERTFSALDQGAAANLARFAEGRITLDDQRSYLNKMRNSRDDRLYVIERGRTPELPIGTVGLHEIDGHNRSARVGRLIFREEDRGLGYGAEAMELLHGLAFRELGLHRLYANVIASNAANLARTRKLGYRIEGRLREAYRRAGDWHDMLVLSLLSHEWQARAA